MDPVVIPGIENLRRNPPEYMKKSRLGLLANPASVGLNFTHSMEIINEAFPGQLTALFSPQHGFHAEKQDNMIESSHGVHPKLNIPIYSLYSHTRIPTEEMFQGIDTLVVDIQDVGTRVYTFIYTLSFCMEVAARTGKQVVVLDRPNPIGGVHAEGNLLEPEFSSFVGRFPMPMRHGLTVGEISKFFNQEFGLGCDLTVISMKGWTRQMLWQDTGLPWIPPSPNLPTTRSCAVYPGQVIFEGTNVSEGRGTTLPFEQFGAPYLDAGAVIRETAGRLTGVHLREVNFEPTFGKWCHQVCRGIHLHILDPDQYRPYFTSLLLLQIIARLHPDKFQFKAPPYEYEYERLPMDLILGSGSLRQKIQDQVRLEAIESQWRDGLNRFQSRARKFYLYE